MTDTSPAPDPAAPDPATPPTESPRPRPAALADPPAFIAMRRIATGLLLAMTALFLATHIWAPPGGVWGYVRAFAEAAMVGGLADWFAVTAIFRRPLGLPIPHTAVIPRNQPRIADAVGRFIADNFLKAELVAERVKDQDLAAGLGRWLADPKQSGGVAAGVVAALPGVLDALDDETVAAFLRKQAGEAASGARVAPAFGSVLEALAQQGRHQAILDALLKQGFYLLQEHAPMIRARVRERTGWLFRMVNVDKEASNALIVGMEDLIRDVAYDPHHPFRQRINEIVAQFADDLRDDPVLQKRIETWMREAAGHPSVVGAMEAGWAEFRVVLRRDCANPDGKLRAWLGEALRNLGEGLIREPTVREALNERVRGFLVELADRHGEDVAKLVSDTIRAWDAGTVVEKLEANVGRDLQYIRLNGTVIGGLVGLALHAGAVLLG